MWTRSQIFVGGEWVAPSAPGAIEVVNPATEEVLGTVPDGTPADVDRAVAAARAAFPSWSATPLAERTALLESLAAALAGAQEELAQTITAEMGAPIRVARAIQAQLPQTVAASFATIARDYEWEREVANSLVLREPIGVVAAITPWNYPLHQVVNKVAPALATGCTVVLKPSEVAPYTAFRLMELLVDAGLPPGVVNLVSGTGPVVGEALAAHPDVDLVHFTGSTRAGRRVSEIAAATVKRVALELGGKSANLVLPDADLAKAVKVGVANAYLNGGQTCTALSRLLVPQERHDEAVSLAVAAAETYQPGDPTDESTRLGPMASAAQRDRVRDYVRRGLAEGATLATGGPDAPAELPRGYFVRPTVLTGVTPAMTVAQEEIFGPVLTVLPYRNEDDAVRIANGTPYGLAAAVWGADADHALAVARRLQAGQVDVNGGRFNPLAPFGGYKQSGTGRELGVEGLEEFLEVKAIQR
jgi:aldehyde dehydrogenase (NAD+)